MAEFVIQSVCKITWVDWLPSHAICFLLRPGCFVRKNCELIWIQTNLIQENFTRHLQSGRVREIVSSKYMNELTRKLVVVGKHLYPHGISTQYFAVIILPWVPSWIATTSWTGCPSGKTQSIRFDVQKCRGATCVNLIYAFLVTAFFLHWSKPRRSTSLKMTEITPVVSWYYYPTPALRNS